MTRSYGQGPDRQQNKKPDLREGGGSNFERKLDSLSRYKTGDQTLITPVRVDFGKRFVAGILDLFAAYLLATIVQLIPFVNDVISMPLTITIVLLTRDWFYEGRAIGKNLMGLQVVDIGTGRPCSLIQSCQRNIILFGAPFILYIIMAIVHMLLLFHVKLVSDVVGGIQQAFSYAGFLYIATAIPYEAYRAYHRADGRRLGDLIAGTAIVEAPMDFSKPVPRENR